MDILPWFCFVDVLALQDQGKRILSSYVRMCKGFCCLISFERIEVVTPVGFIRSTSLGMAPNSVLKNSVPNKPSAGHRFSGVITNL